MEKERKNEHLSDDFDYISDLQMSDALKVRKEPLLDGNVKKSKTSHIKVENHDDDDDDDDDNDNDSIVIEKSLKPEPQFVDLCSDDEVIDTVKNVHANPTADGRRENENSQFKERTESRDKCDGNERRESNERTESHDKRHSNANRMTELIKCESNEICQLNETLDASYAIIMSDIAWSKKIKDHFNIQENASDLETNTVLDASDLSNVPSKLTDQIVPQLSASVPILNTPNVSRVQLQPSHSRADDSQSSSTSGVKPVKRGRGRPRSSADQIFYGPKNILQKCDNSNNDNARTLFKWKESDKIRIEIPENWLRITVPFISPYVPQEGDKIVYLRDAHECYLMYEPSITVRNMTDVSELPNSSSTHAIIMEIRFQMIDKMPYANLKLLCGNLREFSVIFMPNREVPDFIVLQQLYARSQKVQWENGNNFRSLMGSRGKSWWNGTILRKSVYDERFPDSLFRCYECQWGDFDDDIIRLSPWDLVPIDPNRVPKHKSCGIVTTNQELLTHGYHPITDEDWPIESDETVGTEGSVETDARTNKRRRKNGRKKECYRIFKGIVTILNTIDSSFLSPVISLDKSESIIYPIDLTIIMKRLNSRYYRRVDALRFDVEFLKRATMKYFEMNGQMEKRRNELFIKLIHSLINDVTCDNASELIDDYFSILTTSVVTKKTVNTASAASASASASSSSSSLTLYSNIPEKVFESRAETSSLQIYYQSLNNRWCQQCKELLDELMRNPKYKPFCESVDPNLYQKYYEIIKDPMHFSLINAKLNNGDYKNPEEFRNDMRKIPVNAKIYTPNSKMPIRIMAKQLSSDAETKMRAIISDWKSVVEYNEKLKNGKKVPNRRHPIPLNQMWRLPNTDYF